MKVKTSLTLDFEVLEQLKTASEESGTSVSFVANTILQKYFRDPTIHFNLLDTQKDH